MKLGNEILNLIPLYTYVTEWSKEDNAFLVSVAELQGCKTHGRTQEEAMNNAREAAELWLEVAVEDGEDIPLPHSMQNKKKNFIIRAEPDVYKMLWAIYRRKHGGISFNKFMTDIVIKDWAETHVKDDLPKKDRYLVNRIGRKATTMKTTKKLA